jgi:hypothetical protein
MFTGHALFRSRMLGLTTIRHAEKRLRFSHRSTVGSFWPYVTTFFDYIHRAMPYQAPGSLSVDDYYALTAYILSLSSWIGRLHRMNGGKFQQIVSKPLGHRDRRDQRCSKRPLPIGDFRPIDAELVGMFFTCNLLVEQGLASARPGDAETRHAFRAARSSAPPPIALPRWRDGTATRPKARCMPLASV